jgi:molecular chaperone GrpE
LEKEQDKKEKHIHHPEKKNNDVEIEKLKKEKEELNDKVLRLSAEMQNMKRRNDEERSKLLQYDGEDFIKSILPIVDNFERAILLDDANLSDDLSKFLEGFKMIYGNLEDILKNKNIKEIDCLGKEFDPSTMEAVLTEKVDDKLPGIVIDILQKGYTYNDKVIRHAMVKVSE